MTRYARLSELYAAGPVPWDNVDPPPEVLEFVPTLQPGRALDLGCGLGRAALYMARLGWQVDGVDFIPQAITEATARAAQAGLSAAAHFHCAAVTELDFLHGPYDFALDVGCMHSFDADELHAYNQQLLRLLRPSAVFLLFAHLNDDTVAPDARRWMDESLLRQVFGAGFAFERVEYGMTQVGDQAPWRSAWFWLRKRDL